MTALTTQDLSEIIFRKTLEITPMPGHAPLLDGLHQAGAPEFTLRLSRGGWYRPGRILGRDGTEVSDDATNWVEDAWQAEGEDAAAFSERYAECGYQVTRMVGVSHYFVSPLEGNGAGFLQLEVEELQEVLSHPLVNPSMAAETAEQLLEPSEGQHGDSPLGRPRYAFRRLTDMAQFLRLLADQPGKPAPVLRFVADWEASSAGQQRRLCDHWVLALGEHLDRYRQIRRSAVPAAARNLAWHGNAAATGMDLARELHNYDRDAGYGFAWFFHMVSAHKVPRSLPAAVFNDLQDGLAYLPARDAALVRRWMEEPYAL